MSCKMSKLMTVLVGMITERDRYLLIVVLTWRLILSSKNIILSESKKNISDVDYKDGDEASLKYTFTDPMFRAQYKFEQWINSVELKDEEALQHE